MGEHVTVLTAVDQWTQSPISVMARAKGPADEYVVRAFLGFVHPTGWTTMEIRCDPERDIHTSPKGSKGSLGMCEATHLQLQGQIRTMCLALEERLDTICASRTGKDYKHEMFEFGEQLLYKESSEKRPKLEPSWEIGVHVGRLAKSSKAALLTAGGFFFKVANLNPKINCLNPKLAAKPKAKP
eukprot:6473363-Amphidinium_carterae.3